MNDLALKLSDGVLRKNTELEFKIKTNTELHRKGFGSINLLDSAGVPVPIASITLRQKSHEYKFGCNIFMLEQFPDDEHNQAYEKRFADIFNLAVAPFYWSDLEPEPGKERFEKNSAAIYRRPPPDIVCDFCKNNAIQIKGHPLAWYKFIPEWVPRDKRKIRNLWERRFAHIAERYAAKIHDWDVYNEAQTYNPDILPEHSVELAFELAEKYFPGCKLNYNDDNMWFQFSRENTPPYLLVEKLLNKNLKVSGLGLQFHMFEWLLRDGTYQKFMDSERLYQILDQFSLLKLPINMSEVSIISRRDLGDGDRFQELVAEKLYRLWFSHPATDAIIWWNMVDGTGAGAPLGSETGENSLRAGLVNYDMTPKPAYKALQKLIKEEWWTHHAKIDYINGGDNSFHGFYGDYDVEITTDHGKFSNKLKLSKFSRNEFTITI
jgi:GH35 family endo-1,4-beta-xylanase